MNCDGCENGRYQCPGRGISRACPMLPPDNGADARELEPDPPSDAAW